MLDRFKDIKTRLLLEIDRIIGLSSERGNEKIVENLKEIRDKLVENRFHLVVLGQFKRGKSTFINSIIGHDILPTSVVPLTAIVTILRYGKEEKTEVIFEDGHRKEIPVEDLPEYVSEEKNPKNEKHVKYVEIFLPSDFLKDGVCIIDTPGVGSTFENNTEMTYNYLPKVDAALFLFTVDPPISQSEIDFLKDVHLYVDKIFFIQNKIDYLSEKEREESKAFSKQVIEKAIGRTGIEIYPLSAKLALKAKMTGDQELLKKSLLPEFDETLGHFLLTAKGKTVLRSVLNSTMKLLSDEELTVQVEFQALETPLEELEKKINLFQKKMEAIQQDREDIKYFFDGEIQRIIDFLDRDLERLKEKKVPGITEKIERVAEQNRGLKASEYQKLLESTLHEEILRTLDEWVVQEEKRLNKEYARVSRRFSESTNEIIEAIVNASRELFDLDIERFESEENIVSDSNLYYMTGEPPKFFDIEGAFDFFSKKLLPSKIFHSMILKDVKNRVPGILDKNCGRVRWDFMDRIKRSFMNFRWDLNLKIDATEQGIIQAIEKAIDLKKQSAEDMAQARVAIKTEIENIEGIKESLKKIESEIELL